MVPMDEKISMKTTLKKEEILDNLSINISLLNFRSRFTLLNNGERLSTWIRFPSALFYNPVLYEYE
jgi:hypothetical protein